MSLKPKFVKLPRSTFRIPLTLILVLNGYLMLPGATPRVTWSHLSTVDGVLPDAPAGPTPIPPNTKTSQQTAVVVGDVDGDDDMDFIITDRSVTPSIVLYRRVVGGWTRSDLERDRLRIEAGGTMADIDKDGDLDLVFGRDATGGEVWWWENPLPSGSVTSIWRRRVIKSGGRQGHDQVFGDFDGDGEIEFATWVNKSERVEIYEIPSNPKNSQWNDPQEVSMVGEGMWVDDIDLDGKVDLLAGTSWIRQDNNGKYYATAIDPAYPTESSRIVSGQFIPGGRPEIVINSGDGEGPLNFYRYGNGRWEKKTLIQNVSHGHTLQVGDIDLDGHLDFFAAEMADPGPGENCKAWLAWGDGEGNFELEVLSEGIANHESKLVDLDADGDLDILSKPYKAGAPRYDIFINETPQRKLSLDDWERHSIDSDMPWQSLAVTAADVNGDGKLDIVSGGWWYRNPGRIGGNWSRSAIGGSLRNMAWVHDFDGDGDVDIFGTDGRHRGGNMGWARNDGTGNFTYFDNVDFGQSNGFIQGVSGANFTPGGAYQVIIQWQGGESGNTGVEAFTVPDDPSSQRWKKTVISSKSTGEELSSSDIDGDGDLDLFQGQSWLRNESDGTWTYFKIAEFPAQYENPDRVKTIDIDGDGDEDGVVGLSQDTGTSTDLLWIEHPTNPTDSWPVHVVASGVFGGYSLDTADIDYDGDADIVLGEHRGGTRTLIFENAGKGESWIKHVADPGGAGIDHHDGTQLFDLDDDGDLDIVSIGWDNDKLWVIENQSPVGGDVSPPTPPADLVAKSIVGPSIRLDWSPSTDNQSVVAYLIYRDGKLLNTVSATYYVDSDVTAGSEHTYYIVASDGRSNLSEASASVTQRTPSSVAVWWNQTWSNRALITVDASGFARFDAMVDLPIDFTKILAVEGKTSEVESSTLRVIEVSETGSILDTLVPLQFDPDEDFDSLDGASGRLIFPLSGETGAQQIRFFHVYFAPPGSGATPLVFQPDVALVDDVEDEGQASFQFTTLTGDMYYHKQGAGFSSWDDVEGNDWIAFAPTGDENGNYRGIPNLVYPEGFFHAGETTATSEIESQGPLKTTIRSLAGEGAWECIWEIYGRFARLTVLKAPSDYWFLYEGVPGGSFDGGTDFVMRANGVSNLLNEEWQADHSFDEWVYVADPKESRSLYFALHQADQATDSYRPYKGAMTVLAFGRDLRTGSYLRGAPKTFTMGLVEETDYEKTRPLVESAYKSLSVSIRGIGEVQGGSPKPTPDPDTGPEPGSNVISNGDFESGTNRWLLYTNGTGSLSNDSSSFSGSSSALVSIDTLGSNVQLLQRNIALEPNTKYRLSFAAFSTGGRDLTVSMSKHGTPYTGYGLSNERIDLGSAWGTHTVDFTTEGFLGSVDDGRLYFWFARHARAGDLYHIDNVVLTRIGSAESDVDPPSAPATFTATLEEGPTAKLAWTAAVDNIGISYYRILRDGARLADLTSTSYVDTTLSEGATYVYSVIAFDGAGNASSPSNDSSVDVPGSSPPDQGSGANVLANGSFESGMIGWNFYSSGSGGASAESGGFSGPQAAQISIESAANNIQLFQNNIALEPNTAYRVSFAAYSTGGRAMEVSLAKHGKPYTRYGLTNSLVALGTGWQSYTFDFTTEGFSDPVSDGRLYFWFADHARSGDRYYIDNVVFSIAGDSAPDTTDPSTPSAFAASLNASGGAQLSWNPASDNVGVSFYRIFRDDAKLAEVATTSFTDSSLIAGKSFRYRVASVDAAGNVSSLSSEASVQVPDNPGPGPESNAVANGGFESGMQDWTFYSNGSGGASATPTGYLSPLTAFVSIGTAGSNMQLYQSNISLEPDTAYRMSFAAYSSSGNDFEVSIGKHSAPYTNFGLNKEKVDLSENWKTFSIDFTTRGFRNPVEDGRIFFWFAGQARSGDLYYLDQVVLVPLSGQVLDATAPTAPTSLVAKLGAKGEALLSWTGSQDAVGVLGYMVYRNSSYLGNSSTDSFMDDGFDSSQPASYKVTAFDAAGNESGFSNQALVDASSSVPPPTQPQNLKAMVLGVDQVYLAWDKSPVGESIAFYRVYRDGAYLQNAPTAGFIDADVSLNQDYKYRVEAVDFFNQSSAKSAEALAHTGDPVQTDLSIVENGDFEEGLKSWNFYTNGSGNAGAEEPGFQGSSKAAKLSFSKLGSNMQLFQSGIVLEGNSEYDLIFSARSSSGSDMSVSLSKHSSPYQNFGLDNTDVELTTDWQTFAISFTTKNISSVSKDGRLFFWFADDAVRGDTYYLDKVLLMKK